MSTDLSWPCRVAGVAALSMLSGCGVLTALGGSFEPPDLRIQGSRVGSYTPTALGVMISIEVYNPNPYDLEIQQLTYALHIAAQELARGRIEAVFLLASEQSHAFELTLLIDVARDSDLAELLMLAEVAYDLQVTMIAKGPLLQREVDLSRRSVLRLDLPLGLAARGSDGGSRRTCAQPDLGCLASPTSCG